MGARPWEIEPFAVIDGGLSTALELLGHRVGGLLWTAELLIAAPDEITRAHRTFVDAGADVIISASYQASVDGFVRAGCTPAQARQVLASTTEVARRAGARVVASSLGPFGATLGDGSEYHGRYTASWDEVRAFHRERLSVLADTGPDLFAIETIPSLIEAEIVVEELARACSTPAWVSFSCHDAAHTCAGDAITDAVTAVGESAQVVAVGVNCTDPVHVEALLRAAARQTDRPLVAYPNHGRAWDAASECWVGDSDDRLAASVAGWRDAGARLIGGCCGIGPDGVRAIVRERAALTSGA